MNYKNINQWKDKIKQIAIQKNLTVQEVQQQYILEEFAKKISKSAHKNSIILKGGFVVSAILGIDERKTRDIDFTYNSTIYTIEQVNKLLNDIINTETHSFFKFEVISVREEQLDDHYSGFCCMIDAIKDKTRLHFKLDISNNTLIYPNSIQTELTSSKIGRAHV